MTPEQALGILAQATSQVNANRETHLAILAAIDILKKAINKE